MRLLITGGAGCLGAAMVERFAATAEAVAVLDNLATGSAGNLPAGFGQALTVGDVADAETVEDLFRRFAPTHVVHAAASYKDPDDWLGDQRTNVGGSVVVARACDRHGVRRLINLQTVLCYGRPAVSPVPETHPTAPVGSYAVSKTAGESYMAMARTPFASLRLANVTGPRLAVGPIPAFFKRLGAGQACTCTTAVRDFLHMDDFLDVMDLMLGNDAPRGIFNVASGQGRSIAQVFGEVARCLGQPQARPAAITPVGDDDVEVMVPDPGRLEQALGWRARRDFATAVADTVAWYRRHGVGVVHSHLRPVGDRS